MLAHPGDTGSRTHDGAQAARAARMSESQEPGPRAAPSSSKLSQSAASAAANSFHASAVSALPLAPRRTSAGTCSPGPLSLQPAVPGHRSLSRQFAHATAGKQRPNLPNDGMLTSSRDPCSPCLGASGQRRGLCPDRCRPGTDRAAERRAAARLQRSSALGLVSERAAPRRARPRRATAACGRWRRCCAAGASAPRPRPRPRP